MFDSLLAATTENFISGILILPCFLLYRWKKEKTPKTQCFQCFEASPIRLERPTYRLGRGCYGTPVNHTLTSSCYSITKTERKIIGYWFIEESTGHGCCTSSHGQN